MNFLNKQKLALTAGITGVIVRFFQMAIIKTFKYFMALQPQKSPWCWGWGRGEEGLFGKMSAWTHDVFWLIGTFIVMYLAGYIFAYVYNYLLAKK